MEMIRPTKSIGSGLYSSTGGGAGVVTLVGVGVGVGVVEDEAGASLYKRIRDKHT